MKTSITTTIDIELVLEAKELGLCLSAVFNDHLKTLLPQIRENELIEKEVRKRREKERIERIEEKVNNQVNQVNTE